MFGKLFYVTSTPVAALYVRPGHLISIHSRDVLSEFSAVFLFDRALVCFVLVGCSLFGRLFGFSRSWLLVLGSLIKQTLTATAKSTMAV